MSAVNWMLFVSIFQCFALSFFLTNLKGSDLLIAVTDTLYSAHCISLDTWLCVSNEISMDPGFAIASRRAARFTCEPITV